MPAIPVHSLTSLDGSHVDATWEPIQGQRMSIVDMSNPRCPRHLILDSSGVVITRPGQVPVHLSMAVILKAALMANPGLDVVAKPNAAKPVSQPLPVPESPAIEPQTPNI